MQVKDSNRNRNVFGTLALICLLLQLAVAPNIGIGNGRANMALVFAGLASMLVGGQMGVIYGFAAGLVFDFSTTGPIGLMAFLLTVASYIMGSEGRNRLADGFQKAVTSFSGMSFGVSLGYHIAMLLVGDASSVIDAFFFRTVPTTLLTVLAFLPFAWFLSQSSANSLKLGGKSGKGKHGSRYELSDV